MAGALQQVRPVDARRGDPDEDLPGGGLGVGDRRDDEGLWPPGLGNGVLTPGLPTPSTSATGTPTPDGKVAPAAPVSSPTKPVTVVIPPVAGSGTTPVPQVGGTEAGSSTTAP